MYTTRTILTRKKYLILQIALIWGLLVCCAGRVEAQRVYANAQTNDATILLASVTNPGNAIDTANLTNYSQLNVLIGALGAIGTATQNLTFTGTHVPVSTSPVTVRFTVLQQGSLSVLQLLGGVSLETNLNNGAALSSYSNTTLLTLLGGLFSPNASTEVTLPGPNATYNGIRFNLATVLGLGLTARYYYAFFIVAPSASVNSICPNQSTTINITNYQNAPARWKYRVYSVATGGTAIDSFTTSSWTTPSLATTTDYYLEAVDSAKYLSARTKVTVTVNPLPVAPTFAGPITACKDSTKTLTVTSPATNTVYRWYKVASGGTAIFTGNTYTTSNLAADTTLYVDAYNTVTGCLSSSRTTVTITVTTVPNTIAASQSICTGGTAATLTSTLPATAGSNTFLWQRSADNITFAAATPTPNTGITYAPGALTQTYYYRRITTLSGCASTSNVVTITVSALPTITAGSTLYSCLGSTSAPLPYTATTGSPNQYSVTWTGSPIGLPNITNAAFSGTSGNLTLTIQATAVVGTYNGVLTVKNSSCTSTNYNFSLTIQAHPSVTPVNTSYQ